MLLGEGQEPDWGEDSVFGHDSVDSIVYGVLASKSVNQADRFRTIKRNEGVRPVTQEYHDFVEGKQSIIIHINIINVLAESLHVNFLRLNNEDEINRWYERILILVFNFISKKNKEEYSTFTIEEKLIKQTILKYGIRNFINFSWGKFMCTMQFLKARQLALLNQEGGLEAGNGNAEQRRNRYLMRDIEVYQQINRSLQTGKHLTFSTREFLGKGTGLNGETESEGLLGDHAYAIINTRRRRVDGREYLFLAVMNPWAQRGVVYDSNPDGIRGRAIQGERQGEREEGVFLLELKEFIEATDWWYTT